MADLFELNPDINYNKISTLRSELETLKGTVSNFKMQNDDSTVDVDQGDKCIVQQAGEWTLEMNTEKNNVVTDLQTCLDRIKNIIDAIECVKTNHTGLQENLELEGDRIITKYGFASTLANSQLGTSAGGSENSFGNNGMGSFGSSWGGGAGVAGSCCSELDDADLEGFGEDLGELFDIEDLEDEDEISEHEGEVIDIDQLFDDVEYIYNENLQEDSEFWQKVFGKYPDLISYDEDGYARLDARKIPKDSYNTDIDIIGRENRYVIACSSSIGNVGDVLRFEQKDGSIIECVVGYNNDNQEGKERTLQFIVNPDTIVEEDGQLVFKGEKISLNNIIKNNKVYEHIPNYYTRVENKSRVVELL